MQKYSKMAETPEIKPIHGSPAPDPERVRQLREQIAELKKSWPAHSVSPSMLQRLDDLEDELESELSKGDQ